MEINIQNPGSALGEAIGAEMEKALNNFLETFVENLGYHFISKSVHSNPLARPKKLLLFDKFGTAYNIDSVIADEAMRPIILLESKYIRYKKHNRDKGSWICTAHPALRRRYTSIRSSIAVLAGSWSSSSLAMMHSFDINIFLIPFQRICDLLGQYSIEFNWEEKDRVTAVTSWEKYFHLLPEEKSHIGQEMISLVKDDLSSLIQNILDDTTIRELRQISVELHSNLGEVRTYEFATLDQAVNFLNQHELQTLFITTDSPTLFDVPTQLDD